VLVLQAHACIKLYSKPTGRFVFFKLEHFVRPCRLDTVFPKNAQSEVILIAKAAIAAFCNGLLTNNARENIQQALWSHVRGRLDCCNENVYERHRNKS